MGISHVTYPLLEIVFKRYDTLKGITMCELGNQHLRKNYKPDKKKAVAKKHFQNLGIEHTSIDKNGKNGALKLDLCKPINFRHSFQIVTNFGTTEHVKNQYQVFRNIHNFTAYSGYIIHAVPEVRSWIKHCSYWYTERFFAELAKRCGYNVITIERLFRGKRKWLVAAIFRKIVSNEFMEEDNFRRLSNLFCESK